MIYYSVLHTRNILLLTLFLIASNVIFGQVIDFCGTFPSHQASSSNPDSIYWDRFGNSYDFDEIDEILTGSSLNDTCQAGYYKLDFLTPLAPGLQNVFCEVFSDLSNLIPRPINIDGCGDTVESDFIYIQIARRNNLGNALMAATSTYPTNSLICPKLVASNFDLAFFGSENIFGNDNLVAGSITVNSSINNWYTGTGSIAGKYDAYTVILHEALHLLGYSSIFGIWDGTVISKYDSHIFITDLYNPGGPNNDLIPLFLNDCNSNCWDFNDSIFVDSTAFVSSVVNNCSSLSNYDFVIGETNSAPMAGGYGMDPTSAQQFRNYMSHLNPTCNGQNEPYVMSPQIDTGIVRDEITNIEKSILCKLGYDIDLCNSCFLIVNNNTIQSAKQELTCCDLLLTGCINDSVIIEFDDLLCNDFSDSTMTIIDFMRLAGTPNVVLNQSSSSISFLPPIQGRYIFEYTVAGCQCQTLNGRLEVNVGPCINCDTINPCENLVCSNGFEEFTDIGVNYSISYELTGTQWGHLEGDNSVDLCNVDSNYFLHIGSFTTNREGLSLRLSESVDSGCIINISFKASSRVGNDFSLYASEFAPCSLSDTVVGLGNSINNCETYVYHPVFIGNIPIDSISTNNSTQPCPVNPNFGSYSFIYRNDFNFPINYILIEPKESPNYNYIDDIIIIKDCANACFNFSSDANCNEVSFTACEQDSTFSHLWFFGDDSTSIEINPIHVYANADTYEVTHIILDNCDNSDTSVLNVIVSSLSEDCCPDTVISTSTTWDSSNLPNQGRFHTITVNRGVAFTINDDVVLQFCEGGALIIEPGAYVDLEGDLTSFGDMTWKGVYVTGDSALNQANDLLGGGFNGLQQGYLQTRSGASIKNAEIAIRNYGKSGSSSSGGMIRCQETLIKNNTIGVDFIEYQNFNDSINQPLPSLGSFIGCRFYTDSEFHLQSPFYAFVRLSKIDGPDFKACKFVNSLLPELPSQVKDFGFGILATDSEFKVHPATSTGAIGPCPPPCTMTDSTLFSGLGHGIYVMTGFQARPYSVYNSLFENCFRGITDITRGGATILFNTFNLGEVPDEDFSHGQIGADFHFAHDGFTIQENLFIASEESDVIPIGLLCNGLGEFDNEIRRNTFIGVETANQVFGENADTSTIFPGGLRYFCNTFKNTLSQGYDFHIPNTPALDLIHLFQTPGSSQGSNVSAGNHFAYTAQDFMNYGEGDINYWYYPPGDNEEPRDSFSLGISDFQGDSNSCSIAYCALPCIEDIEDIKNDFLNHLDSYGINLDYYLDALISENLLKIDTARSRTLFYRRLSSADAYTVVQHLMIDTLEYNTDSLIRWMGYLDTYGAEVMIAGEYASAGDFESAVDVLETITARRDLTQAQSADLNNLLDIYYLLEEKSLESFTLSNRSFLRNIAYSNSGVASGVSRALLSSFGEYIPLPYYHGEQINFRNVAEDSSQTISFNVDQASLKIYPNPTSGDVIIEWEGREFNCVSLFVYNLFGEKIFEHKGDLIFPYPLNTDACSNGMHWIIAMDAYGKTVSGKFILIRD